MKIKSLVICFFTAFALNLNSQINTIVIVEEIPFWQQFENMTEREIEQSRLYQLEDEMNSAFIFSDTFDKTFKVSELQKEELRKYYTKQLIKEFNENRSRYYITEYDIDLIDIKDLNAKEDTLSSHCICELNGDIIQIKMGVWIFGGFEFEAFIKEDSYDLYYIMDSHENSPYRYSIEDTIQKSRLRLQLENSEFLLQDGIGFNLGSSLNGYIEYTLPEYFYTLDESKQVDRDHVVKKGAEGRVYFKCKLKEYLEEPDFLKE